MSGFFSHPVRSKYGSKKEEVDGITFDSKKEANAYRKLKLMEEQGLIRDLKLQVPFELIPPVYGTKTKITHLKTKDKVEEVSFVRQRAVRYVADFVFYDVEEDCMRVIDVKGFRTKEYDLKKKMMLAFKGIEIEEI